MAIEKSHYDLLFDLKAALENEGVRLTELFESAANNPTRDEEEFVKLAGFLAAFNEYYEILKRFCETTNEEKYNILAGSIGLAGIQTEILEGYWKPNINEIWHQVLSELREVFEISDPNHLKLVTDQITEFEGWIKSIEYDDFEISPAEPSPKFKNPPNFNI